MKVKTYKVLVKDRMDNKKKVIECKEYSRKSEVIKDLRANGYIVNDRKVKEAKLFDYIVNKTDMNGIWT